MIVNPKDNALKAMILLSDSPMWEYIKAFLEENLEVNRAYVEQTFEPLALNRLIGEQETILKLIDIVEHSREIQQAGTDGGQLSEIGLNV